MNAVVAEKLQWYDICPIDELVYGTGVCALVAGRQIALFAVDGQTYALDNYDPASRANVLSRGLTGDLQNQHVVASPIYKHHYVLSTGKCLEDAALRVAVHATRVVGGMVQVALA